MNVLLINYEFPPLGGGASNATYNIAKCMSEYNHNIFILSSLFKGLKPFESIHNDKIKIIRIPVFRKYKEASSLIELLLFAIKSPFYAIKIARQFNIKNTIAFFSIPSAISAIILKSLYKIPYIVSLRGADVPGFVERRISVLHTFLKPLTKLIWRKATHVIANSNGLRNLALKTLSKNITIDIIPNGIDSNFYTPNKQAQKDNKPKTYIKLLFVGRFSKQKGWHTLIELIDILRHKINFKLHLVGDGPDKKHFETKIQKQGLKDFVSYSGWLSKEDLAKEYKKHDILTIPSLSEGMPNVVSEAMASGLAIVASKISGSEELVIDGYNGFLYELGDTKSLADKIINIYQNDSLDKMKLNSRKLICDKYSWEKTTLDYIALLKNSN